MKVNPNFWGKCVLHTPPSLIAQSKQEVVPDEQGDTFGQEATQMIWSGRRQEEHYSWQFID